MVEDSKNGLRARIGECFVAFCHEQKGEYRIASFKAKLEQIVSQGQIKQVCRASSVKLYFTEHREDGTQHRYWIVIVGTECYLIPRPARPEAFDNLEGFEVPETLTPQTITHCAPAIVRETMPGQWELASGQQGLLGRTPAELCFGASTFEQAPQAEGFAVESTADQSNHTDYDDVREHLAAETHENEAASEMDDLEEEDQKESDETGGENMSSDATDDNPGKEQDSDEVVPSGQSSSEPIDLKAAAIIERAFLCLCSSLGLQPKTGVQMQAYLKSALEEGLKEEFGREFEVRILETYFPARGSEAICTTSKGKGHLSEKAYWLLLVIMEECAFLAPHIQVNQQQPGSFRFTSLKPRMGFEIVGDLSEDPGNVIDFTACSVLSSVHDPDEFIVLDPGRVQFSIGI